MFLTRLFSIFSSVLTLDHVLFELLYGGISETGGIAISGKRQAASRVAQGQRCYQTAERGAQVREQYASAEQRCAQVKDWSARV